MLIGQMRRVLWHAGHLSELILEPSETIFEQESRGDALYVIGSGVAEISRRHDGAVHATLGRIGPGEYIGELGPITCEPRPVTMRALTRCSVRELPAAALRELLALNVGLNAAMERSVRRGMKLLDRDDAARMAHPVVERAAFLARIRSFFSV